MGNGKKLAAGGAAAALALGAADVARVASHDTKPVANIIEHTPRGVPGEIATDFEHAAVTGAAGENLDREASESDDATDVMCAAFSYYDDLGFDNTSFDDFAEWAGDEVNNTTRKKAEDIYNDVSALSDGDWTALASTYCDVP